jgi:hypothetical protein
METLVKIAIVLAEILTNHGLDSNARWVYCLVFWQKIATQYAMCLNTILRIFCIHYFEFIFKSLPPWGNKQFGM